MMEPWYVACRERGANVMHPAADRDRAIDYACRLLRDGRNVVELGPMLGEGRTIGADEIRKLRRKRLERLPRGA